VLELGTRALPGQSVKTSFYYKDDTHREGNIGEPERSFRDQSFSIGLEDTIPLTETASVVLGFSADHIQTLNAENFAQGQITPFAKASLWAYNPQVGFFFGVFGSGKVHLTFARKTRLPTMKDRYSYRLGQAIPNPDLKEERSNNWEVGYSHVLGLRTLLELAFFRSDLSNSTQRFYLQPNLFQLRNLGDATYQGTELSVKSNVTSALLFTANYTYLNRRNNSDPSLIFVDTPRHRTYSSLSYRFGNRFTALADLTYEAGRWNQNDAGKFLRAPQFAVVGIYGTAHLYRQVELQVGAGNLFDRNYSLVDGYQEIGRNAYVNLRYQF
jgi:iron complex outermembrane receptor protein